MSYPYTSLTINNREVTITSIVNGSATALSEFERSCFEFIQAWLTDVNEFEVSTSGSTGAPKVLRFSKSQMIASAMATIKALGLQSGMTALLCIDTKFIGGKMMLVRSLHIGMKIIALEPEARPMDKLQPGYCVNFAAFVPYQIYSTLEADGLRAFDAIKKVIIGGAPLSNEAIEKISLSDNTDFYLTYGMTETLSHIALSKLNRRTGPPLFELLPGVTATTDGRGCLVINVPYLPAQVVTNDVVQFAGEDSFTFVGRFDNVINSGGVKIQPELLEEKLRPRLSSLAAIKNFFIIGVPHPKLGHAVALVVEFSDTSTSSLEKKIPEFLHDLHAYERPKVLFTCSSFELTATGKINRVNSLAKAAGPISL